MNNDYNVYFQLLAYLLLMLYDSKMNRENVASFITEIQTLLQVEQNVSGVKVTKENVSVLLVNIVMVINDDRWDFVTNIEEIISNVCEFIQMYI